REAQGGPRTSHDTRRGEDIPRLAGRTHHAASRSCSNAPFRRYEGAEAVSTKPLPVWRIRAPLGARIACVAAGIGAPREAGGASAPTRAYAFASAPDSSVDWVYVPVFTNTTYSHGIELDLTDAIVKQLKSATPWKVTSESPAQTTLTGRITDSRLQALSLGRTS